MTKDQIKVLWVVAVIASVVLVFVGLVRPYLAKDPSPGVGEFFEWLMDPPATRVSFRPGVAPTALAQPNYWAGLLAPVLILGGVAYLQASAKGRDESGEDEKPAQEGDA